MKAYWPWLLVYVLSNIAASLIIFNTEELIGDASGIALYSKSALFYATVLVVSSYVIILWPIFSFISKIKIRKINTSEDDLKIGKKMGVLLIFLQISFMIFNMSTGVNIAGSSNIKTDSIFSLIWIIIPIDTLFFIYYGMYRENKYFYPNLCVWLVSNILRGWASVFLFLIFFEWCRAIRNNKITVAKTIMVGAIAVIFYPILTNIKWLIRAAAGSDVSFFAISARFFDIFEGVDFFSVMGDGIFHLMSRFQVTSLVVEVMRISNTLQIELIKGNFTPFWMEGLHGIILNKLFDGGKYMPIGVAFTQYGDFGIDFDVGDWNTNIGYVGWFFITPYLIPIYILYTLLLGFISFYLVKKIGITESSRDMLWLAWLVYLMPPWLAAFTGFIYTLFLFLLIKIFLGRLPRIGFLLKQSHNT